MANCASSSPAQAGCKQQPFKIQDAGSQAVRVQCFTQVTTPRTSPLPHPAWEYDTAAESS